MIFTHMIQETPRTHRAIRNRWIVFGFVIACLALLVPRIVSGQASAGITGTITDTSGAVVTNAKVTATELSTSAANHTVSSSVGTYAFKGLNPGKYTVTVEASGFKKAVQEAVTVEVSTTATIDFTVSAGTANETVQVTAAQIALNTTAAGARQHYRAGGRRSAAGRKFQAAAARSINCSSLRPEPRAAPSPTASAAVSTLSRKSSTTAFRPRSRRPKAIRPTSIRPMNWWRSTRSSVRHSPRSSAWARAL